jgi:hypothetical protein
LLEEPFGFSITDQKDGKSIIKDLQTAFFFDVCDSDYTLRFVRRGAHPAALLAPESDLGLAADKKELVETLTPELDQDLPRSVVVQYSDPSLDYQAGAQLQQRSGRIVATTNAVTVDLTQLAISGTEARSIAQKTLYQAWAERTPWEINFSKPSYLLLDPTDTLNWAYEGQVYQQRLTGITIGQNFATKSEGVSQLAAAYASSVGGAPSSPVQVTVAYPLMLQGGAGNVLLENGSRILMEPTFSG